jgi:3-isopropylmalate dehydrogenase
MLLDHLGLSDEAAQVREGVNWTLKSGFVTLDIDPVNNYSTSAIGDLIAGFITRHADQSGKTGHGQMNQSTII